MRPLFVSQVGRFIACAGGAWRWCLLLVALPVSTACLGPGPAVPATTSTLGSRTDATSTGARAPVAQPPFAPDGPFNRPIPPDPVIDAGSAAMVAYLARKNAAFAGLFEFGIPIWDGSDRSPRRWVTCRMDPVWGACPFSGAPVPIPPGAHPHRGSDGAMVIVDWSNGHSYEFWQAQEAGDRWVTSWGAVQDLRGPGFGGKGSSTAAGASRLAGVVRVSEIEAGRIPHALAMSIDNACARTFRAPALKTDGESTRGDCTPEGARLQLDPAIDVDAIAGITPAERMVAKALQIHGAYVIDKGGAPMAISFELARDAISASRPGAVYQAAGLAWDYFDMPRVPWARLRVLAHADGS